MDRSQVCLADLRLNSTGNNRFYRSLLEEHIQALNIKSEPSGENVGMGKDHTLFALVDGTVAFVKKTNGRSYVSVTPVNE